MIIAIIGCVVIVFENGNYTQILVLAIMHVWIEAVLVPIQSEMPKFYLSEFIFEL